MTPKVPWLVEETVASKLVKFSAGPIDVAYNIRKLYARPYRKRW